MNNQTLTKGDSNGIAYNILKWSLLIYTAWRSYDLLSASMPEDSKLFAIFGLVGLDLGVLIWSHLYETKARGHQTELSAILTALDLVGVALCLLADTVRHSAMAGQYVGFINTIAVWVSASVILLNAAGGVIYPMMSPDAAARRRAKAADDEYTEKLRNGEHRLKLAELDLQNARLETQARKLNQTASFILGEPFSSVTQPAASMAKDAPFAARLADEYSGKNADELRELLRNLKGQGDPK